MKSATAGYVDCVAEGVLEGELLDHIEAGSQARIGIGKWLAYYNVERPHSTHGILTPDEAFERKIEPTRMAA